MIRAVATTDSGYFMISIEDMAHSTSACGLSIVISTSCSSDSHSQRSANTLGVAPSGLPSRRARSVTAASSCGTSPALNMPCRACETRLAMSMPIGHIREQRPQTVQES